MKKVLKGLLAAAFAVSLVIGMAGCDDGNNNSSSNGNSDKYIGKDVLGNTYSLSVGGDARSAKKGDHYSMSIKTRDGKTRTNKGTVKSVNDDGTVTLQPDNNGPEFTAVVDGSSLDSVVGQDIPFTGTGGASSMAITPRTFDTIHMRAGRWDNHDNHFVDDTDKAVGENWGTSTSVLVTDFPSNVSKLEVSDDRYTITISGTSNVDIDYGIVEVQGIDENGDWDWFTSTFTSGEPKDYIKVTANIPFENKIELNIGTEKNLMDYKEVVLQFTNELKYTRDDIATNPTWSRDNGSLDNTPDGTIMATISNLKIVLRDTDKDKLAGNMGDYHYGYQEDGLSIAYQQAVWTLDAENIAMAKVPGAKFEFFVTDAFDNYDDPDKVFFDQGPTLAFIWQDPVRGLWWQDMADICGGVESKDWAFELRDGVTYDSYRHKISVDLSTFINDNQFANANELNFIVACWWNNGWEEGESGSIDELGIAGGNIVEAPLNNPGNLGKYYYGDESVQYIQDEKDGKGYSPVNPAGYDDYYLVAYNKVKWMLSDELREMAQADGAQLVIEFENDLEGSGLVLAWFDPSDDRWWPEASAQGTDSENLYIYRSFENGDNIAQNGATYDSTTKTLVMPLSGIETYDEFVNANELGLALECWWYGTKKGLEVNFNHDLVIKSANIKPYVVLGNDIVIGDWTWNAFSDGLDNGGSSSIIMTEADGTLDFSGVVTDKYVYSYVGWNAQPADLTTLTSLTGTSTINFKVQSDEALIIAVKLPMSSITDYRYHQILINISGGGSFQDVSIAISEFEQPNWGPGSEDSATIDMTKVDRLELQINLSDNGGTSPLPFSFSMKDLTVE